MKSQTAHHQTKDPLRFGVGRAALLAQVPSDLHFWIVAVLRERIQYSQRTWDNGELDCCKLLFSTMILVFQSVLQSLRQDSHMLNSSKGQSLSTNAYTLSLASFTPMHMHTPTHTHTHTHTHTTHTTHPLSLASSGSR